MNYQDHNAKTTSWDVLDFTPSGPPPDPPSNPAGAYIVDESPLSPADRERLRVACILHALATI